MAMWQYVPVLLIWIAKISGELLETPSHADKVAWETGDQVSYRSKRYIFPGDIKNSLQCPEPHGLFRYAPDCTRFLQCAHGRPFLMRCGPGTAFNPAINVCDHLRNVDCGLEETEGSVDSGLYPHRGSGRPNAPIPDFGPSRPNAPRPDLRPSRPTARPSATTPPRIIFPTRNPHRNYVDSSSFRPPYPIFTRRPVATTRRPMRTHGPGNRPIWSSGRRAPQWQPRLTTTTQEPVRTGNNNFETHYVNNSGLAGSLVPPFSPEDDFEEPFPPFPAFPTRFPDEDYGRDSGTEDYFEEDEVNTVPSPTPASSAEPEREKKPTVATSLRFHCPSPFGYFADPDDCTQFLQCVRGKPVVQKCGINTYFNNFTKTCGFKMNSCKARRTQTRIVPPEVLSATAKRSSYLDVECPLPNGLFPYGKDCKKFIECWNNRPFVKSCALGTLFSASVQQCDHQYKVICTTPVGSNTRFPREVLNPPESGQVLRLRGGQGPHEGYIQVYKNRAWGTVCDPDREWGQERTDAVCRQMGFTRGSVQVFHGSEKFGESFGGVPNPRTLHCNSTMESTEDCEVVRNQGCDISASAVAVRCQRDYRSRCPAGMEAYDHKCFLFMKERMAYQQAKSHCETVGGHLVDIDSQTEMDWLSETLRKQEMEPKLPWYTGGVHIRSNDVDTDFWDASSKPINYYNWWPGWPNHPIRRQTSRPINCIALNSHYPSPKGQLLDAEYYFWTASSCRRKLPFVCEMPQIDIGCYSKKGHDYRGRANITESGNKCISWDEALSMARKSSLYGRNSDAGLEGSLCRNPFEDEEQPWCFLEDGTFELCDIPMCNKTEKTPVVTIPEIDNCAANQFECYPGKCIYLTYVCNDKLDCPNGQDESNCTNYLPRFKRYAQYRLHGHEVEKWLHTDSVTCARRCAENKNFVCRSFSFRASTKTCVLSDSNVGMTGSLAGDNDFEYYEYEPHIIDCSHMFVCDNGKCINNSATCDGNDDCKDNSDERTCERPPAGMMIRLVNGSRESQGRIEVKVDDKWGTVCSNDNFDLSDAHVMCKQMGYELGAAAVHTGSKYGKGNSSTAISNMACKGNESSINDCQFPGWGTQRCSTDQAASICCLQPERTCEDKTSEWMCMDGERCISTSFLCDGDPDCSDGSDESALCETPEAVRLAGGKGTNPSEGRLEIRHHGVWGTVCDDQFTILDASVFCRMLGFTTGASEVITDGRFGEGKGPIWLDNLGCKGKEDCLLECPHLLWGSHNCHHSEDVAIRCSVVDTRSQILRLSPSPNAPRNILPEDCGTRITDDYPPDSSSFTGRVVAGVRTVPGAHPWQASIRIRKSKGTFHWCGAIILSEFYVLTAGHCLEDYKLDDHYVRVGDFDNRRKRVEDEEEEFNIETAHIHDNMNRHTKHNNDIALLKLKPGRSGRGIQFGKYVRPVCLPERNAGYDPGRNCTISGWGSSGLRAQYANKLHTARIPLLSDDVCRSKKLYGDKRITDGMFCAGYLEGGIDSCQGDSGGPYTCEDDGRHYLYGIISWGIGCAEPNKPGVYVRVGYYLQWIYEKLLI